MMVIMESAVMWDVTTYSPVEFYRRFWRTSVNFNQITRRHIRKGKYTSITNFPPGKRRNNISNRLTTVPFPVLPYSSPSRHTVIRRSPAWLLTASRSAHSKITKLFQCLCCDTELRLYLPLLFRVILIAITVFSSFRATSRPTAGNNRYLV